MLTLVKPKPMTKVLVLSQHSGQIDRRIVAEMNTLAASGRDVTLVSVPTVIPEACLDQRVRVVMPAPPPDQLKRALKGVVSALPPWLGSLAKTVWHRLHPLPQVPVNDAVMQAVPPAQYDVIHCHDLDTLPTAVAVRDKLVPPARLIYDSHELFPFQFPRGDKRQRYWSRLEETYIRAADLVITVNASIAQELAQLYSITPPEIVYNSYGTQGNVAPLDEQAFLQHFRATPGGFRVMFQGGFVGEKNLYNLVRAFQRFDNSVQLFLLGDGPIAADLHKLCRTQHIGNVFFGPWVPQEELLRYIAHAHLGVIPYSGSTILNNLYCTPNKLFEFIEAVVPICASDLPELRRIVAGNGIGGVYPMEDAEAIADAIEACRTRCRKDDFALSARQVARELFSWDKQGAKLLELYDRLGV
jgi:glycosyltransferase involved in cell wall biosynthesis